MKPKYSYSKLKGRIIEKFGTQEQFAEHLQISRTSMSNKMTGKTGLSQDEIILWCKELDIQENDIGAYFFK